MIDKEAAARIRLLILDVDGVLTDGRLGFHDGEPIQSFDVKDGLGIRLAQEAGVAVALLTARDSAQAARRGHELGVASVLIGRGDKSAALDELLAEHEIDVSQAAAMGDDLPDLPVLRRVGVSLAPSDAALDVVREVDIVLERPGGRGAVREAVEAILRARGDWEDVTARFWRR